MIDLNCDMGESYGTWVKGDDRALLPYVTSINIACGFHAGDSQTMRATVAEALEYGVRIGAHPGLPDLQGFGRREMRVSPDEVYNLVLYQTGALYAFVKAAGGRLHHVKPHGALYNMAARDAVLADAIVRAIQDLDPTLWLYGLSGSEMIRAAEQIGLKTASEVFADRTYEEDGTLTPRHIDGALISDQQVALTQVLRMLQEGKVRTRQGKDIALKADTVCVHGDGSHALPLAKALYGAIFK